MSVSLSFSKVKRDDSTFIVASQQQAHRGSSPQEMMTEATATAARLAEIEGGNVEVYLNVSSNPARPGVPASALGDRLANIEGIVDELFQVWETRTDAVDQPPDSTGALEVVDDSMSIPHEHDEDHVGRSRRAAAAEGDAPAEGVEITAGEDGDQGEVVAGPAVPQRPRTIADCQLPARDFTGPLLRTTDMPRYSSVADAEMQNDLRGPSRALGFGSSSTNTLGMSSIEPPRSNAERNSFFWQFGGGYDPRFATSQIGAASGGALLRGPSSASTDSVQQLLAPGMLQWTPMEASARLSGGSVLGSTPQRSTHSELQRIAPAQRLGVDPLEQGAFAQPQPETSVVAYAPVVVTEPEVVAQMVVQAEAPPLEVVAHDLPTGGVAPAEEFHSDVPHEDASDLDIDVAPPPAIKNNKRNKTQPRRGSKTQPPRQKSPQGAAASTRGFFRQQSRWLRIPLRAEEQASSPPKPQDQRPASRSSPSSRRRRDTGESSPVASIDSLSRSNATVKKKKRRSPMSGARSLINDSHRRIPGSEGSHRMHRLLSQASSSMGPDVGVTNEGTAKPMPHSGSSEEALNRATGQGVSALYGSEVVQPTLRRETGQGVSALYPSAEEFRSTATAEHGKHGNAVPEQPEQDAEESHLEAEFADLMQRWAQCCAGSQRQEEAAPGADQRNIDQEVRDLCRRSDENHRYFVDMLRRKEQSTAELNGRVAKLDGRLQELRKAVSALAVVAPGVTAATGVTNPYEQLERASDLLKLAVESQDQLRAQVGGLSRGMEPSRSEVSFSAAVPADALGPEDGGAAGLPQRGFQKTGRGTSALAAKRRSLSPIVLQVPVMSPVFAGSASPRRSSPSVAASLPFLQNQQQWRGKEPGAVIEVEHDDLPKYSFTNWNERGTRVSNLDARYLNFKPPNQNAAAPLHTVVSIPASEVVVQSAAGPPGEQETAAESGGHDKFVLRPQLSLLSQVRGQGSGGARSLSAFGYSFAPGGK